MSFLPPDYKEPEPSGKYYKLKQGENRFRVLGSAISGNLGWTVINGKKKPIRHKLDVPFSPNEVDFVTLKHFIAFPVWNYDVKKVQVAEFTQTGIRKPIIALARKIAWGDPSQYDIVITREGEGMETTYQVTPEPKTPLDAEAAAAWEKVKANFDLTRLFDGGDAFEPSQSKVSGEINVDDIPF